MRAVCMLEALLAHLSSECVVTNIWLVNQENFIVCSLPEQCHLTGEIVHFSVMKTVYWHAWQDPCLQDTISMCLHIRLWYLRMAKFVFFYVNFRLAVWRRDSAYIQSDRFCSTCKSACLYYYKWPKSARLPKKDFRRVVIFNCMKKHVHYFKNKDCFQIILVLSLF